MKLLVTILLFAASFSFSEEKLKLYLFASSTCEKCRYLKELVLPDILELHPQLEYEHIKVDDTKGFELMLKMEGIYRPSTSDLQTFDYQFIGDKDASVKAFIGKPVSLVSN